MELFPSVYRNLEYLGGTNGMQLIKIKFAKSITLFTALLCVLAAVFYGYFFPEFYTKSFPFLLAFFYLFGFVSISVYSWAIVKAPNKAGNYYLAVRMLKMLIVMLGAFIYCLFNRAEVITFIFTLAVIYLVYLVFETRFYYTSNLAGKTKNKNDETNK